MKRRDFITLLGGAAAAWPLAAHAQQATPVIGFLDSRAPDSMGSRLRGFHRGLKETGFVEGENVAIAYRWGENQIDRLPALVADLVRQRVAVIVSTGGTPAAQAAMDATTTIPVVFLVGADPVQLGLVTSLARPSGNLTGLNLFNAELEAKRLELLREFVPRATRIAVMVNPSEATNAKATVRDVGAAARTMGLQVQFFNASTPNEIDTAFANLMREKPEALFIGSSAFMNARRVQLTQLAAFHRLPTAYSSRESVETGGLMSYASVIVEAYRQWGAYAGRLLKGAKPADLPVVQAAKFELVINVRTARMLGVTVPQTLLTSADEVIEAAGISRPPVACAPFARLQAALRLRSASPSLARSKFMASSRVSTS